ncbi:hypothetical protein F511_19780 [Dorcoceras hygrometricum]|uniref:Uncharacterized protein n=1 Tax=Dorcoceras hygrometricum TaxID=472368 RepID=A0A2Z7BK77_9LAMI|nr:hypothetical protein F511_19780 [Dorcoceras hygrometricum]
MANQTDDDEVFDFSNVEFTREDLFQALNDMVHEYKTLSHTLEEIKAENATASLHDLCSRLESTSLEESDDDVAQRTSAEGEQPAVVTTDNTIQQDPTAASNSQMASSSPAGQSVARDIQQVASSPAGQPVATPSQLASRPSTGEPAARTHQLVPPAGEPVAEHQSQGTLALYRVPGMASSLISNSHHIDFESVFRLDDAEFFANSSVREDDMVVSTISGTAIEISQAMFAAAFELPTEGLIDLTDVPKNFVFDARSLFSDSKEQVSMSCLKKALKFHYRLLHDILAKTIYVKAGSFDCVTRDRFLLMTVITFDIKINWSSLLFGVFKEMVTPGSRQAKGYAIQICVLLRNVPGVELGESKSFPVPRILNEKTVHRFVSINENVGIKEVADAPRARKTPVNKTMSKKRQAAGETAVGQVIKKKRSTKGKLVVARRISL